MSFVLIFLFHRAFQILTGNRVLIDAGLKVEAKHIFAFLGSRGLLAANSLHWTTNKCSAANCCAKAPTIGETLVEFLVLGAGYSNIPASIACSDKSPFGFAFSWKRLQAAPKLPEVSKCLLYTHRRVRFILVAGWLLVLCCVLKHMVIEESILN